MDKVKSPEQVIAQQRQKANAILSAKRLDHIERRVDEIHMLAGGVRSDLIVVRKHGQESRQIELDQDLAIGRIAADVAMLDRRVDSFKTWNMIRDIIVIVLLVLLLALVGYNTTQFWGW